MATLPPAERMRLYRRRRRQGKRLVRIPLHVTEIDTLILMGLLTEAQRQDTEALQTAILSIVYQALETADRGVPQSGPAAARHSTPPRS